MATIYDAARRAGVTAATVSNVVTGKGKVGKETHARVLAALAEVDYRPNLLARGLARRRSLTLALLLPNIADPFYPPIALEVERIARERGYHLLLCNTHGDTELGRTRLESLSGRMVDGILTMAGDLDLGDGATVDERGLPLVLCTCVTGPTNATTTPCPPSMSMSARVANWPLGTCSISGMSVSA